MLPAGAGPVQWPQVVDYDGLTRLAHERETLGFVFSEHPLRSYSDRIASSGRRVIPAKQISRYVGRRVNLAAWSITGREVLSRKGEPMKFVSFEDETEIFETTFFPRAYQRFCQILDMNRAYLLSGRVQEEHGAVSLNVEEIKKL